MLQAVLHGAGQDPETAAADARSIDRLPTHSKFSGRQTDQKTDRQKDRQSPHYLPAAHALALFLLTFSFLVA
jgi:hypothetical protein